MLAETVVECSVVQEAWAVTWVQIPVPPLSHLVTFGDPLSLIGASSGLPALKGGYRNCFMAV